MLGQGVLPSQVQHLEQEFSHAGATPRTVRELIIEWAEKAQRPAQNVLVLDTSRDLTDCVTEALTFITSEGGANGDDA